MANKSRARVLKAETNSVLSNQISKEDSLQGFYGENAQVISPPYNLEELSKITENSTILQQCIDAYTTNLFGFGIDAESRIDLNSKDMTSEQKEKAMNETKKLQEFIRYANLDEGTETVFQNVIEDQEKTGNGYIEVLRDGKGQPAELVYCDSKYMRVCKRSDSVEVDYTIMENGEPVKITRRKCFRKFVQIIDDKKVWFKEYGDPRIMDSDTGKYVEKSKSKSKTFKNATEIIHFKIGTATYGVPRWIGNVVGLYGARKAEELNLLYFVNGRHVPAAVIVEGGLLDEEAYKSLEAYMQGVSGTENAYQFLVLEVQGEEITNVNGDKTLSDVNVEIKSLADMIQKDAMFLEYDATHRKKMRSSFRLPPIYTGEADEYNKATAETARKTTEEQVFQPMRRKLARKINGAFLEALGITEAKLVLKSPDLTDIASISNAIYPFISAASVIPNDLRPMLEKLLNRKLDDLPEEYNKPISILLAEMQAQTKETTVLEPNTVQKSLSEYDNVLVMKQVRDLLQELKDDGKL
ncbi:phage portal protein [Listeria seeligeri]|uniref:phage portal protein n=1 Tax=Listeria seeligeri TaxID=1640 RepID=UPI00162A56EA|nr:phage portal protein [Listeria seeligeri]MBC1824218.1 phage portal protein [Listeria seeligeri]MBC1837848.1 phage portal protein [Listeria seeligeri]